MFKAANGEPVECAFAASAGLVAIRGARCLSLLGPVPPSAERAYRCGEPKKKKAADNGCARTPLRSPLHRLSAAFCDRSLVAGPSKRTGAKLGYLSHDLNAKEPCCSQNGPERAPPRLDLVKTICWRHGKVKPFFSTLLYTPRIFGRGTDAHPRGTQSQPTLMSSPNFDRDLTSSLQVRLCVNLGRVE
jgi:hypothetical protein